MATYTPSDDRNAQKVTDFILPTYVNDATANDSDKSWVIPTGQCWKILWAHLILATTGTAGARQIRMEVTNGAGTIVYIDAHAGATQTASQTRQYTFVQGLYRATTFVDNDLEVLLPPDLYIPEGNVLRFYDSAAIDAAADDLTVAFAYQAFLTP